MCYYLGISKTVAEIEKRFERPFEDSEFYEPTEKFNGFAKPALPIISNDKPDLITSANWGIIGYKDAPHLNARIETIDTLNTFRDINENRCLIIADCYYDWRHEGKNKIPYAVYSNENEIFCFAGLYLDTEKGRTFTIVTTEANEVMKFVHNTKMRMPVMLNQADEENWLNNVNIKNYQFPYSGNLVAFPIPTTK